MKKIDLKQIDNVSKIALIILIAIVGYFLIFLIISSLLTPKQTPMMQMMNEMIGTNMMSFSTTNSIIINLVSLVFGAGLGFLTSLHLFRTQAEDEEYTILRKALSDDEKKILDEIKRAGEITQDSLRFRLEWSKAKISTILTNLDKRGLIQRERIGKTYKVYLQK
ncbi:MAG: MarR family transcriptional regulator [Nanoarchaeota archaeon]|nr:MarR family transcriptional regulator [Nanoarchaeota archaeon]